MHIRANRTQILAYFTFPFVRREGRPREEPTTVSGAAARAAAELRNVSYLLVLGSTSTSCSL